MIKQTDGDMMLIQAADKDGVRKIVLKNGS